MRTRQCRRGVLALLLVLGTVPALHACGGEGEGIEGMPPPPPSRPAAAPSRAAAERTAAEVAVTSRVAQQDLGEGARDPFTRQFPENQTPIELDSVELGVEETVDLGPLANFPVESLRLIAIITRTAEPKAMFMLPDGSGLGVLARVNDRVGPNGTGRIADIQPNRVIISYEGFGFGEDGEQARTLVLTLRDPALDIEATFEPY